MKFVTARKITDLDGKPVKAEGDKVLTMGQIAENALLAAYQDETNLEGSEKVARFILATKLHKADISCDITVEEGALVKKLVAKGYTPLVVGQIWEAIDNPVETAKLVDAAE